MFLTKEMIMGLVKGRNIFLQMQLGSSVVDDGATEPKQRVSFAEAVTRGTKSVCRDVQ